MQKKRSRKNGTATDGPTPAGRRVRVRRRLVIGVAVTGLTVLAAGAPAVVSATRELSDSQSLVTLADQNRQILTLTHLLADERDAAVEYAAKGRPGAAKAAVQERAARTDRQLAEARAEADEDLADALARVRAVRTEAVDGKGSALAAHQAYSGVITDLLAPGDRLAGLTPPRAEAALATTRPLTPLGQAVEQAAATRGLLLAALAVPRGEQPPNAAVADELTTAAQRARVREQAALEDFTRSARPDVRQTLAATVTGPEVKTADDYLKRLTDRPTLSSADRRTDPAALGSALTARIDRMRSVEATLAGQRSTALAAQRDDDVTRLELVIAVLGVLFLIAVGVSTAVARSLTRPLSVLRRGAQRLATPEGSVEPVRFTGRNDEFAEVVRHLNAVRDQTVALHTRIAGLDADSRRIMGRNEALTAGREALTEEIATLRAGLEEHRRINAATSVSLSLRTLGLVERQLSVIEELESKEQDPDRLATLFRLDHLATVMRRHNENLLVLAGQEHGQGQGQPVPIVDVLRAAVSEIERYERVDLAAVPSYTQVAGHAADDISHVLAELLENATTFSPPEAKVKVSGRLLDDGDVVLSVVDQGIGITADRLDALNARLATPDAYDEEPEAEHGLGLGLYVAGRLAARHGVTAELRAGRHGGTEALVVVPAALLPSTPPVSPVHTLGAPGAPALHLPGVIAEANENTLPGRVRGAGSRPGAAIAPEATAAGAPKAASATDPAALEAAPTAVAPGAASEAASEAAALQASASETLGFETASEAAAPQTSAAEAASEAAAPQASAPEIVAPEAAASQEAASEAAAAQAWAPEAASQALAPETPAPEAALQGVASEVAPQGMAPGAAPEAALQQMVPGAAPEAALQQMVPGAAPEAALQGVAPEVAPQQTPPEAAPQAMAPGVAPEAAPQVSAPDVVAPRAVSPEADPEVSAPPAAVPAAAPAPEPWPVVGPPGRVVAEPPADRPAGPTGRDAEVLPPADEVFTAARPAATGLPAADQVFTAARPAAQAGPGRQDQLLARVVPDAETTAFAPAEPAPAAPDAGPVADVPETRHHHTAAEGNWVPRQGSHPADAVTDKGLPKRTPRSAARADRPAPAPAPQAPPAPPRRIDADELRRRLGGFYQGAQDGRRVVAAEFAQGDTDPGDTAQEART